MYKYLARMRKVVRPSLWDKGGATRPAAINRRGCVAGIEIGSLNIMSRLNEPRFVHRKRKRIADSLYTFLSLSSPSSPFTHRFAAFRLRIQIRARLARLDFKVLPRSILNTPTNLSLSIIHWSVNGGIWIWKEGAGWMVLPVGTRARVTIFVCVRAGAFRAGRETRWQPSII